MPEKIEAEGQKAFLGWRQFWLRSIAVFIPYIVLHHIVVPVPFTINTSDPLKIFVYYFLAYLSTYLVMWVIVAASAAIISKASPRLRALPLAQVVARAVPYVLIPCGLMIFGQWYGRTFA